MKLSVIIPCRNEFPNVVHTVHSIYNAWDTSYEALGWNHNDIEIIIVNNCSTDREYPRTAVKGTHEYLVPRAAYSSRYLRQMYDPIAGNHSARTKGAEMARGEFLFFSDAHMSYAPRYFEHMVKATQESGGIVHSPISWLGAYPHRPTYFGYQYTIKIGDEWRGTWAHRFLEENTCPTCQLTKMTPEQVTERKGGLPLCKKCGNEIVRPEPKWFYIPALGHCSLMMRRDQFFDFGGYQKTHRAYGGGEMYLNMKWWMLGSSVACEPKALGWHLASERGYSYRYDDYISNVLACMYALGVDDWRERAYINWLRKGKKEVVDALMVRGEKEMQKDREFIEGRRKYSFNELLLERPWDKGNIERFGYSNCGLQIFHETFINMIKGTPAERAYNEGKYQVELEKFINENLSDFVYKRSKTTSS